MLMIPSGFVRYFELMLGSVSLLESRSRPISVPNGLSGFACPRITRRLPSLDISFTSTRAFAAPGRESMVAKASTRDSAPSVVSARAHNSRCSLTCSTVRVGSNPSISPMIPAICGAADEVPPLTMNP